MTLGENAPSYREGAGIVTADSLAAESIQAGGEFANNRNINISTTSNSSSSSHNPASTQPHETPASARQPSTEQGGPAPTYVNTQQSATAAAPPLGGHPHGRNITEDPEMIGRPGKFNVEVGSREDPAREAERTMLLKQTRGAPGSGEREVGVKGGDEQPYSALGGETSA